MQFRPYFQINTHIYSCVTLLCILLQPTFLNCHSLCGFRFHTTFLYKLVPTYLKWNILCRSNLIWAMMPCSFCSKAKSIKFNWVFGLPTFVPLYSGDFLHVSRYSVKYTYLCPQSAMSPGDIMPFLQLRNVSPTWTTWDMSSIPGPVLVGLCIPTSSDDSTTGANRIVRILQPLPNSNTSTELLRFRASPIR